MGQLTGGDPSLLRRINSAVVLHALRATDCATLTEIARVTGLSRPTVPASVDGPRAAPPEPQPPLPRGGPSARGAHVRGVVLGGGARGEPPPGARGGDGGARGKAG